MESVIYNMDIILIILGSMAFDEVNVCRRVCGSWNDIILCNIKYLRRVCERENDLKILLRLFPDKPWNYNFLSDNIFSKYIC